MDHIQIIKDIKNKVYHPVYFLTGDETYYIDLISDYIENNVLDETEKDFNQTILYGKESDITTIISEAKRYPMMANNNVVIIKEAQHLGTQLDKLEGYLENPTPSTLLVFCYKYKKVDGRKAIGKLLKKKTVYFESKKLYDNQVPDWITGYLKKKRYTITPSAAMLIADSLGNDLSNVVNELEKLTINVLEGNEITPDTVEKNIGISKDFNNFELNKALGSKDVLKANKIIFHFSKNERDHPLVVTIGLMYSFFSNILKVHYTKDKSKNNLASVLRVSPFFVGEYETATRNYPIRKSVKIIEYLRDYDLKSKGVNNTSASNSELLKELVFKILH
ncbi:MAG: DNA polymerase III subunit delta [Flavobacteriales bacterium]|nr:MAG: DNA polymerase III subunit delta [Flavobacteriales bacterium]